jgi:hypothetical protein
MPGGVRFGTNGSVFAQANVTNPACTSFTGQVRVLGVRASDPSVEIELARGEATFDPLAGNEAYAALFGALDAIAHTSTNKVCGDMVLEKRVKLAAAPTEGLGELEAAAFESTRERALVVLDAVTALCQAQ